MIIPRFFFDQNISLNSTILLPKQIVNHSIKALRMRDGEDCILFNGNGIEYHSTIKVDGKKIYAIVKTSDVNNKEIPGAITLVQAIPLNDRMNFIIEKATELGVNKLLPIHSERSMKVIKGDKLSNRLKHWRNISISASEQCGRNKILQIENPISFNQYIINRKLSDFTLICEPDSEITIHQVLRQKKTIKSVSIMIGPEGGWSNKEINEAKQNRILNINMGSRILRTETASITAVSAIINILDWY